MSGGPGRASIAWSFDDEICSNFYEALVLKRLEKC